MPRENTLYSLSAALAIHANHASTETETTHVQHDLARPWYRNGVPGPKRAICPQLPFQIQTTFHEPWLTKIVASRSRLIRVLACAGRPFRHTHRSWAEGGFSYFATAWKLERVFLQCIWLPTHHFLCPLEGMILACVDRRLTGLKRWNGVLVACYLLHHCSPLSCWR